jgi:hypothetical protein
VSDSAARQTGFTHTYALGTAPLAPGKHTPLRYEFVYDGGDVGKGGMGTLFVDGQQIGQARVERTAPFLFSADDYTDIGKDYCAEDFENPYGRFTGTINWGR